MSILYTVSANVLMQCDLTKEERLTSKSSPTLPGSWCYLAVLDVFLLSFLAQVGSGGHKNSHGHPRFSLIGDPVEVRVRQVMKRGH